jgi:PKD repeat protein
MKKVRFIFSLLVTTLFALSCKKEHAPASIIATPEFYFNGLVGGVTTTLDAGVNNYYMYSSYAQDTNNVYNFIGDLKQTTSNLNSIQIQINNYRVSALNAPVAIDSALIPANYPYLISGTGTTTTTSTVTVYNVQFNSSYANGTAQTYNWNFGDNTTSNLPNPMHTNSQLGYYNVCLSITGSNSCTSSICDTVNLSSPTAYACHTALSATVTPGNTNVTFGSTTTGTAPFHYLWNYGDSDTISYDSASITHTYGALGTYTATLRVTDFTGKIAIAKYIVSTMSVSPTCLTNYRVSTIQTATTTGVSPNFVAPELGSVVVTWTDASGNVYTSKNASQPAGSNFQIISVDNYPNNTNNQRTKKLHVKFSCMVYNSAGSSVQITNADAIIAVAYK